MSLDRDAERVSEQGTQADEREPGSGSARGGDPTGTRVTGALRGCPPTDLFQNALCLCEDLKDVGVLTVRGGAGGPGSVGVNGATHMVNASRVDGDFTAYESFRAVAASSVGGALLTTGDASWLGTLHVGGDFSVGGDARGAGLLTVDGSLRVAGQTGFLGLSGADEAAYEPPAGPPCPCDPASFFDAAAAVEAARTTNDNARIGLDETLRQVGVREVSLTDGSYYVADAAAIGVVRFGIAGKVALFVEGHVDSVGVEHFHLEPGAELDLYVSGGVRSVGVAVAGEPGAAARLRIYVGGSDPVLVSVGAQAFFGAIYAPEAEVTYVGATHIAGSLFARTLRGVGVLDIEHAAGSEDPDECEPPVDDDAGAPDGEPDAGAPDGEPDAGAPDGEPEDPDGDPGDGNGDSGDPVPVD